LFGPKLIGDMKVKKKRRIFLRTLGIHLVLWFSDHWFSGLFTKFSTKTVYVDDLAWTSGIYIVLYADDILLIAPTVCELQKLLRVCEQELRDLDMSINVQKTCCLRIGPRHNATCATISTSFGIAMPWVDKVKYIGYIRCAFSYV